MKKILMLAALPLIILLLSVKSYAMTQDQLKAFLDREEITYTDSQIQSYFPSNQISDYEYVAYIEYNNNNPQGHAMRFYFTNLEDLEWIMKSDAFGYGYGTTFETYRAKMRGVYYNSNTGFTNSEYNWVSNTDMIVITNPSNYISNGISYSNIDWETIYYNPQIPVPKLNIWYLYQVESYREDGVANFTANIDVPDSTEFYVELAWKYSYPQNIRVYSSDMKGSPAYDYELYQSSDLISIYALQDMQQAINLHVTGSSLQTAWQAAYDDFIDGVTFYTNQSNAPANWLSTARLYYVNKMATQIPLYGNRLEVFARFWTLSEDNHVVVGKWYHWQSAKGSATEDIPENYVNYQELPGYAGTVETVPTDNENTYTGTGESTGEQATTIINYAPNYPDYPTAVSYNHDNILLQMIKTSKQLPKFFGQFTNFLEITLAFIDPGVWAIIGFGFTCCIVIMIIKVL